MSSDDSTDYSYLTKHSKLNSPVIRTQAAKKPTFLKRIPHFSQIDPTQMDQFKVYSPFTFSDETDIYEPPFTIKKPITKLTAQTKQNRKFKSSNRSLLSSSSSSLSSMSLDDEVFDSKQRSSVSKANDMRLVQQAAFLLNQKKSESKK